jgi:hypothetical protein
VCKQALIETDRGVPWEEALRLRDKARAEGRFAGFFAPAPQSPREGPPPSRRAVVGEDRRLDREVILVRARAGSEGEGDRGRCCVAGPCAGHLPQFPRR